MSKTFYSTDGNDFRVGDSVRDRESGELGIVQRIENAAWSGATTIVFVYLVKKGYVKQIRAEALSLISRAIAGSKDLVSRSFKGDRPDIPRAADIENIAHGIARPEVKSSARDFVKSNKALITPKNQMAQDVIRRIPTPGIEQGTLLKEWIATSSRTIRTESKYITGSTGKKFVDTPFEKLSICVYRVGNRNYTVVKKAISGPRSGQVLARHKYSMVEEAFDSGLKHFQSESGAFVVNLEEERKLVDKIIGRERTFADRADRGLTPVTVRAKISGPLEELRGEIHRIYGINTRADTTEGAIGRKILGRVAREMRDEQGGQNLFTINTRPKDWAGAEDIGGSRWRS